MNLLSVEVNNLPLTSYVSYSRDISEYVKNILSGKTYYAPLDVVKTSLSSMISSMNKILIDIVNTFGGSIEYLPTSENIPQNDDTYDVIFKDKLGNELDRQKIAVGQSATAPSYSPPSGYKFTGWSTDFSNITADTYVIAEIQQLMTYQVRFIDYDGSTTLSVGYVTENENATPPSNPEREGYKFTSWRGDISNITANIDIIAYYSPRSYIVSLSANGGNIIDGESSIPVTYDSQYGDLPSATLDGYSFDGWFLCSDFNQSSKVESSTYVKIARNHTLYARWIEQAFNVRFVDWNGTVLKDQNAGLHEKVIPPLSATLSTNIGYSFMSWSSTSYNDVTSNVVISANYKPNEYHVTFNPNGGQLCGNQEITVEYNQNYHSVPSAVREDYDFDGWYLIGYFDEQWLKGEMLSTFRLNIPSDHEFKAHWTQNAFTVTFDANGGIIEDSILSIKLSQGQQYGELPSAMYEGHYFNGWYDSSNIKILSSDQVHPNDHTLYAHWTSMPYQTLYNVSFIDISGNVISSIDVEEGHGIDENDVPTPPNVTGYLFSQWSSSMSSITSDIEISAQYTARTYTATFDCSRGGIIIDASTGQEIGDNGESYSMQVTYDQPYGNIPSCLLQDYAFDGWRIVGKSGSKVLSSTIVKTASNHRLTPRQISAFNVEFIDWDGQILDEQTVMKNENAIEPEHPQTKPGHSFDRWSASLSNITADVEISAIYVPNQYVISFDPNGGTMPAGNDYKLSVTYGKQYGQLPEVYYDEYMFDGWYNHDARVLYSTRLSTASDHVLCAHWTPDMTDEEFNAQMQQFRQELNEMSSNEISSEYNEYGTTYEGENENASDYQTRAEDTGYDESLLSGQSLDNLLQNF